MERGGGGGGGDARKGWGWEVGREGGKWYLQMEINKLDKILRQSLQLCPDAALKFCKMYSCLPVSALTAVHAHVSSIPVRASLPAKVSSESRRFGRWQLLLLLLLLLELIYGRTPRVLSLDHSL